ncbi:beta-ketoacyl-[acyl-carrier-protein] synthase family protein [Niabella hibiscisoli]|uniref:beta-ketoacyl-[acyl-carrier-protein] synthase family protein n=1 Tax=Niabella hibiscisoli TaxID=1825928 RepID=UPI001F0DC93A|nr:beta-ketoacyl-[acyl-carrier-protein] synthase family protein [Niabella hibiscisoli]MCH5716339.1 beta-ketoacyl-[acyl-carrier-protein] synthase family protein [Niabella hibiscisoli]
MSRIVVTGIGIITAIGETADENRDSLIHAKTGIGKARFFNSRYTGQLPFGEINQSTELLAEKLGIENNIATRTDLLALHAAKQAIIDANLSKEDLSGNDTALIGGSTVGGMCLTDEMYADANAAGISNSPYLTSYSNSANTSFLQRYFNVGGLVNTFNTACSSSANAIMYGARLLKNGLAKKVIAGGVDSLSKYTVNGFNALMILADEPCRPFDSERKGLNLGEGAAFLVLEREEDASGKRVYAEVRGYGNSNDAFHPSSTSVEGEGPYLSMKRALEVAGLSPEEINFVNAHGTATENNDETESAAMLRLFGTPPDFASTKSYTGHTLGAAGAIEAVYSIISLQHQEVYPSLHFTQAITATGLSPITTYKQKNLQHIMSNSFGFGGNCTSLIFSKM